MHRLVALAILIGVVSACSDDGATDGSGGSHSTSGSGGASGGATGGNNAAGSAAGGSISGSSSTSGKSSGGSSGGGGAGGSNGKARGAASLNVMAPAGCSLTAHYEELPLTAMGHAVTATEKGPGVEHAGQQSDGSPASVVCEWIGESAPYLIQAAITAGAGKATRLLSFGVSIDAGMSVESPAVVTLPDDKQFMGDCTFNVIEIDNTARSIWGSLECDSFVPFEGSDPCALGPSYFFFENCK